MKDDDSNVNESTRPPEVITGIAQNAKAGAVVVADDGSPTYIEGLESWPEKLENKRMKLTGIVRRKVIYPNARDTEAEEMQGMVGTPRVIQLTEMWS